MFDVVGTVTGAGNPTFAAGRAPATDERGGGAATGRRRRHRRRQDDHRRAGLLAVGHQRALRHAAQRAGAGTRARADRRPARRPPSPPASSSWRSGPTPAARSASRRATAASSAGARPTAPSTPPACCRWRRRSTPSGCWRLIRPCCSPAPTSCSGPVDEDARPVRLAWLGEAMGDVEPAIADACRAGVATLGERPGDDRARDRPGRGRRRVPRPPGMGGVAVRRSVDPSRAPRHGTRDRRLASGSRRRSPGTRSIEPTSCGRRCATPSCGRRPMGRSSCNRRPPAPPRRWSVSGDDARAALERRRTATLRLTCVAGLAGAPVVVAPIAVDRRAPARRRLRRCARWRTTACCVGAQRPWPLDGSADRCQAWAVPAMWVLKGTKGVWSR